MKKRELSIVRAAVGTKGASSRWGDARPKSHQVRINADAAAAIATVPERDRRAVASRGIVAAVAEYLKKIE